MRRTLLGIAGAAALAAPALADGIFADSYNASMTFTDGGSNGYTSMTLAWDGGSFWSCNGGSSPMLMHEYDPSGVHINKYEVPIDFRGVFTRNNEAPVLARAYSDPNIYAQSSPGVFDFVIELKGGTLDAQSCVVFAADGSEFVAFFAGMLERWDLKGNYIGGVNFDGWGSMFDEANYPQDRGVAVGDHPSGEVYLTYANGALSAWNTDGKRVGFTKLVDAGTSFDSHFSLSVARGLVWVIDANGGEWRGYDVGLGEDGCYPDCDGDGVLSIDDFVCFQSFFAFGDMYADCDGDGVLSIDDFVCFQSFFAFGCE